MERKYELLKDDTIIVCGHTLYRIKALQDFGNVKTGDLGGYIEKENNLSHDWECWVYDTAKVYDDAKVYSDARVNGNARVYGNAWVSSNAQVSGNAWVHGDAEVIDTAWVSGNARVCGSALVNSNARVNGDALVSGVAKVSNNAYIHNTNDYVCIGPIGSRNDFATFYLTEDKNIMVSCGCFNGTLEEFIKAVNDECRSEYLSAIEYAKIKLVYKDENNTERKYELTKDVTNFKVKSLRVEHIRTYNDRCDEYEDNEKYVLNCVTDGKVKYEVSLWTEYGSCPSGWTDASWVYMTVKKVDNFIGVTHLPLRQLQFSLPSSLQQYDSEADEDISNEVFTITENGDKWYPYAECNVNMDLFKETSRAKEKRPVWIFKGASGLGKSYLAGIIGREKECDNIYETDSSEILENIEHADIIVIGNKYNHTVEDVLSHIQGEIEPILVDFTAIK